MTTTKVQQFPDHEITLGHFDGHDKIELRVETNWLTTVTVPMSMEQITTFKENIHEMAVKLAVGLLKAKKYLGDSSKCCSDCGLLDEYYEIPVPSKQYLTKTVLCGDCLIARAKELN